MASLTQSMSHEDIGIKVERLTARWEKDADPTLRNISFELKPGELLAVIGPVGSGKSTLLMSLLNELPHVTGDVKVNGVNALTADGTVC